jgi:adenosylhomocysteine nucleosidase
MIGIVGAEKEELDLLKAQLAGARTESVWAGRFEFLRGSLEGQEVALCCCNVGKVNSAVASALLVERYKPELLINTGSAGGLDRACSVGDAVIASACIHWDADATGLGYELGQVPDLPKEFRSDTRLAALAMEALEELKAEGLLPAGLKGRQGLIVSADTFVCRDDLSARVKSLFPAAEAVEMEGASIAQTAFLAGIPFLVIRSLSDIAGEESKMSFREFLPLAGKHAAEIVRRLLKKL